MESFAHLIETEAVTERGHRGRVKNPKTDKRLKENRVKVVKPKKDGDKPKGGKK